MTKFVMIMDGRTIGEDGTISDVHVTIVWLVMIGDFEGKLPVCPPAHPAHKLKQENRN